MNLMNIAHVLISYVCSCVGESSFRGQFGERVADLVSRLEPVALERSIQPVELAGDATDELVRRLSTAHPGQSVLVAGHSNTVPAIVAGLGVEQPLAMTEADYGDLFQITLDGRGGVRLVRLQLPD